ncbi:hypothetical protein [Asticcacaulis sp. YBE204]|uniref:hypothetical protein n=1 Tax=Asticcacaulis sp. YBE204 TaxID=1282363 RepID=UPI0003C3DDAA|nr:hypothetical protein [Asticcacaulis sp. YBE204]ESQ76937.1 hypothetical protein AEYBE204_18855 [Asticcacaulis sp. YBE204]
MGQGYSIENECHIPDPIVGAYAISGLMYDTDRTTLTPQLSACVLTASGDWYLIQLT